MAGRKSELGPTGTSVADRVKQLREDQRLGYAELSRQLSALGRDIPPLGLRRIEAGERRVDADDLVALALALGVSPITLLMPESTSGDDEVQATGIEGYVTARRLWTWLLAAMPLAGGYRELLDFVGKSVPTWQLDEKDGPLSCIEFCAATGSPRGLSVTCADRPGCCEHCPSAPSKR